MCFPYPCTQRLRAEDASRPELPALERSAAELVSLVPPLLAAACAHSQEQPLEEWLLAGGDPPPAAHVASYIAYRESDRDDSQPEGQVRGSGRSCGAARGGGVLEGMCGDLFVGGDEGGGVNGEGSVVALGTVNGAG